MRKTSGSSALFTSLNKTSVIATTEEMEFYHLTPGLHTPPGIFHKNATIHLNRCAALLRSIFAFEVANFARFHLPVDTWSVHGRNALDYGRIGRLDGRFGSRAKQNSHRHTLGVYVFVRGLSAQGWRVLVKWLLLRLKKNTFKTFDPTSACP